MNPGTYLQLLEWLNPGTYLQLLERLNLGTFVELIDNPPRMRFEFIQESYITHTDALRTHPELNSDLYREISQQEFLPLDLAAGIPAVRSRSMNSCHEVSQQEFPP